MQVIYVLQMVGAFVRFLYAFAVNSVFAGKCTVCLYSVRTKHCVGLGVVRKRLINVTKSWFTASSELYKCVAISILEGQYTILFTA